MTISKLSTGNRSLMLAYDQGLEHGPADFNERNCDPEYILDIAKKGKFNAVILQKGVAQKYWDGKIPLVLKLNGKTNLVAGEPMSPQICSVKEAVEMGASAVGYTIFLGSANEYQIFKEFSAIQEEAKRHYLPVIAWVYPQGNAIKSATERSIMAYAARVGLELGADILKLKCGNNLDDLKWALQNAGKAKVMIAGGFREGEKEFLTHAQEIMQVGAYGMAIGRNIWQHREPHKMAAAVRRIVIEGKDAEEGLKLLK